MAAIAQRFERFGLTLHPQKPRLLDFQRPRNDGGGPRPSSFDLLGFTHYWGRSLTLGGQASHRYRHTLLGESVWRHPPRRLLRSQSVTSKIPDCTQPCASRFEVRTSPRDKLPELRRVVHPLQVHQLVDHHVVAD